MNLTAANIAINVAYYFLTVGLAPWLVLMIEKRLELNRHTTSWLRGMGLALGLLSIALQLWCIVLLQKQGGGTPSPARPPIRLVTTGPYRFVRNPLNIAELGLFLALAAWFGSPLLFIYASLAWCAFHFFIVGWEEPRNLQALGNDYARYREGVNRWLPRVRTVSSARI